MKNCTDVDEDEDGGGRALTVLMFVMICFIALSMGCNITVEALKEVRQHGQSALVSAGSPIVPPRSGYTSGGRAPGSYGHPSKRGHPRF